MGVESGEDRAEICDADVRVATDDAVKCGL